MEKVKFIKKENGRAFYKLADHKVLTDKLIESLDWPANIKVLVFDFKPFAPKAGWISPKVSDKYPVRVIYYASGRDLPPSTGSKRQDGLELVPVKDLGAFRNVMESVLKKEYIRPIKRYVTAEFMKSSNEFMAKQLKKCRNLWLKKDGRNIGFLSTMSYKYGGKPGTLLAQIWIDAKLSPTLRRDAKAMVFRWLKKNIKNRMATGEHAKSVETQKFFASMGFKAGRYGVERRS
ncbi:MAG: hypothetical protein RDU13_11540 [Elusimicrobiales bacterium]|nr:hypothetical protein [Elusimicrobiales bacterium]